MDARSKVGLTARDENGAEVGRISEVVTDEETNEPTHFIIESEAGDSFEVPVTAVEADEDSDFATFHADRSDEIPGDHTEDTADPEGYTPTESLDDGPEDTETEGQFVTAPDDEAEGMPPEEAAREDWQDEADTPDSGFPRNDAYVDPETGEAEVDPALRDNETARDDAEEMLELLEGTGLEVVSSKDGVIALAGGIGSQEDLDVLETEILGLDGVLDVDTEDIEVG